jgi:hypothetical protein
MEFFFNYDAPDETIFEVKETGSGFAIEVHEFADFAKQWSAEASFVKEWHAYCQKIADEWPFPESSEPPDEDEMEAIHEAWDSWVSSNAFEPQEVRTWAEHWIMFWDLLSDEDAKATFPLHVYLHRRDDPFGREFHIEELQKLVRQAECAEKHQVKMTMEMLMG